jgi:hypothetical protein
MSGICHFLLKQEREAKTGRNISKSTFWDTVFFHFSLLKNLWKADLEELNSSGRADYA